METNNFGIGFRKSRKDKGLKRKEYAKKTALRVAKTGSRILTGAALLGGGLYLNKKLGKAGFFPDITNRRTIARIASKSRENAENGLAMVVPAGALTATTVGADYLIDRKNDLPITRKVRKAANGRFSTSNQIYDFGSNNLKDAGKMALGKGTKKEINRIKRRQFLGQVGGILAGAGIAAKTKKSKLLGATIGLNAGGITGAGSAIAQNIKDKKKSVLPKFSVYSTETAEFEGKKGRSGRKRKGLPSSGDSKNLLSWKRKLSLGGHVAKGATIGAVTEGGLSAIAASPVPVLIPAATAVGATSGAIKGSVLGAATYGVREGIRQGKKRKKR